MNVTGEASWAPYTILATFCPSNADVHPLHCYILVYIILSHFFNLISSYHYPMLGFFCLVFLCRTFVFCSMTEMSIDITSHTKKSSVRGTEYFCLCLTTHSGMFALSYRSPSPCCDCVCARVRVHNGCLVFEHWDIHCYAVTIVWVEWDRHRSASQPAIRLPPLTLVVRNLMKWWWGQECAGRESPDHGWIQYWFSHWTLSQNRGRASYKMIEFIFSWPE